MQTDGRLIKQVYRLHCHGAIQFACYLHSLGFATRERRRALPEREVLEPRCIQTQ